MQQSGPPRLFIDPPHSQPGQQQNSATSPAGPYFSSPATYSPLPFAQQAQPGFGIQSGGGGGPLDFLPMGRQGATSYGYGSGYGYGFGGGGTRAPIMSLGSSQMSEPPSMLRSSSSSSYSSSSSLVPSTSSNNAAYFSPPLVHSPAVLFSPPAPSSPSFSAHSAPTFRHTNNSEMYHSQAPSLRSPSVSDFGSHHRKSHASISVSRGSGQRPRRGPRESVYKLSSPIGIGTRPDEVVVKKRKKVVVVLPCGQKGDRANGETEADTPSFKDTRRPLSDEKKTIRLAEMERDAREGTMLEEDELVARVQHFEEVKRSSLPPTIDVYLPGRSGWDVAREEYERKTPSRFIGARLGGLSQPPSTLLPSPNPAPLIASDSPILPSPATSPVVPPRSHTRTYSLFNSPVALPARLQNVLDSLSRRPSSSRHASSASLGGPTSAPLDPSASSFSLPTTSIISVTSASASSISKLTPFAPSFSMPSWSVLKARAQGVPLPDSDESVEERIEEEGEEDDETEGVTGNPSREEVGGRTDGDKNGLERSAAESTTPATDDAGGDRRISNLESELERKSVAERTEKDPPQSPTEEDKVDTGLMSRRASAVSTRTDRTGTASLSDGFSDRGEENVGTAVSNDQAVPLLTRPYSQPSPSPLDTPIPHFQPHHDLPPLPPSEDGSEELAKGNVETISGDNARVGSVPAQIIEASREAPAADPLVSGGTKHRAGAHKAIESFEFPRRLPVKTRASDAKDTESDKGDTYFDDVIPVDDVSSASLLPTAIAFANPREESSPPVSPTLFGTNGGPGSLAASSLPASPVMLSSDTFASKSRDPSPTASDFSSAELPQPAYPDTNSILCPIPRRPYLHLQDDLDDGSTFGGEAYQSRQAPAHSFDFRAPNDALAPPNLPTESTVSVRKVSHGPLPPIPLVHIEPSKKRQQFERAEEASTSSNSQSGRRPVSNTSSEDAIPPQYVNRSVAGAYRDLAGPDLGRDHRGRRESEDIALPSSSRRKHRALPVPPSSSIHPNGHGVERVSESDYAESIQHRNTGSLDAQDSDDDDTPLRILEGIIERQFERLRADLSGLISSNHQDQFLEEIKALVTTAKVHVQSDDGAEGDKQRTEIGSKLSSLLDGQQQLARSAINVQSTTSALKDSVAQLGLDVTSRLDSAYSALDQRLRADSLTTEIQALRLQLAEFDSMERMTGARMKLELAQSLQARSTELEMIKAELAVARAERDSAKEEATRVNMEIERHRQCERAELDAANGQILALEKRLAVRDERIEALVAAKSAQQQLLAKANRTTGILRKELDEATRNLSSLTHLESINRETRKELDVTREENLKLKDENDDSRKRFRQVELDLAAIRNSVIEDRASDKARIETLEAERDHLSRENTRLARGVPPRSPSPYDDGPSTPNGYSTNLPFGFDHDGPETPPSPRLFSKDPTRRAPKLHRQHTGSSIDSEDTIAHTSFSPTPSVTASFTVSDDGWYSIAG